MRKPLVIQSAFLLIAAAMFVLGSPLDASAGKKCISIGDKRICFEDGKGKKENDAAPAEKKNDDDDGAGDDAGNAKPQTAGNKCAGAIICDPGYVVLDKPNKYGACCEPREGFCPPDRPSGTPPNCCPEGTTFREGHCYPTNCPPGTVGTPPHCDRQCAPGKVKVDQSCYDPCPPGTLGTPPNCKCPDGQIWDDGAKTCKERPQCTGGMVGTPPNCKCPSGTVLSNGTCVQCEGGKVAIGGECKCPKGTGTNYDGTCYKCKGGRVSIDGACQCPKGTIAWPNTAADCVKGNRVVCTWRGTAPFCDGSCEAGEEYRGAGRSSTEQNAGAEYRGGFGSSCASGSKHLCCRPAL